YRRRRELLVLRRALRDARHVHAREVFGADLLDPDLLALEGDALADGPLRGERAKLPHRELALVQDLQRRLPHRARRPHHRQLHRVLFLSQYDRSTSRAIRSPISFVPTSFVPAEWMSRVRWPRSSTVSTAASIRSASAARPSEYRKSIAADRMAAMGLATPWPAMSGAVPCTGS